MKNLNVKKQEFLEQLQEQLEFSRVKKLKEIEASKLEDQKDKKYLEMRDKRDSDEEKRMRMKHFGENRKMICSINYIQPLLN